MAEQRMSATLTRLARKRGRLPALVTAALIAAALLLQSVISSVAAWIGGSFYERVSFGASSFDWMPWQPSYLISPFLQSTLPFALGVFLCLWLIAPLAGELTLRFVITRGLLASAAGTVLVLLVAIVVDFITMLGFGFGFDIRGLAHSVIVAIGSAVDVFVYTTPIVLLAVVLLWLWLREHPREYEVAGLIDEL